MGEKEEIIAQLKRLARKAHDTRQRRQYDIVRLYLQGWKKTEIAKIMDMSFFLMLRSKPYLRIVYSSKKLSSKDTYFFSW